MFITFYLYSKKKNKTKIASRYISIYILQMMFEDNVFK